MVAFRALSAAGYIGGWHVDFTVNKLRGAAKVGDVFGLPRQAVQHGVSLSACDAAYLPEDLEMVRQVRRDAVGVGGQRHLYYRLVDQKSGCVRNVHSIANIVVDRYGALKEARGLMFQVSDPRLVYIDKSNAYWNTLRLIKEAAQAAGDLDDPSIREWLQELYEFTINKVKQRDFRRSH